MTESQPRGAPTARVDVAVVIVNWNTKDCLEACLRSVFALTQEITFQVFVVDNASADGSAEMVRTSFPQVRLLANTTNRGFAAANNQAMREASARYVLLLNPDTIVLDHAIQRMVRYADADPGLAVAGCQVLEADGVIQQTCFRFPSPLNLFLTHSGLARIMPRSRWFSRPSFGDWDRCSPRDVDVVSGMFMLVRAEAIAEVGLMDEAYFVYAEEADWCFRFWRAGWRCAFTPLARIMHVSGGGKSTVQVRERMHVQLQKSLLIFHRKNLGRVAWAAAKLVYVASGLARAAFWRGRSWMGGGSSADTNARCASAALKYQLFGVEPKT